MDLENAERETKGMTKIDKPLRKSKFKLDESFRLVLYYFPIGEENIATIERRKRDSSVKIRRSVLLAFAQNFLLPEQRDPV